MSRRRLESPPVDHAQDRAKWAQLIGQVHEVVATDAPTLAALELLASQALRARTCWVPAAPWPRGLVCGVLTAAAVAYGRQGDVGVRQGLRPALIAAAGLVDQLLADAAEPVAPVGEDAPARGYRAPYADL